jgi:chorismate mutase
MVKRLEFGLRKDKIKQKNRTKAANEKFAAFLFLKGEKIMKLEDWRTEIDEIDSQIVGLLNRRARAARNVGAVKAQAGLPIVDIEREDEVLRKVSTGNEGIFENQTVIEIYGKILQNSRQIQIETMKEICARRFRLFVQ